MPHLLLSLTLLGLCTGCGLQVITADETVAKIQSISEVLNMGDVEACGKITIATPYGTAAFLWARGGLSVADCQHLW